MTMRDLTSIARALSIAPIRGMGMRACAPTAQARRHRQNLELMSGGAVEQVDALLQGALEAAAVDGERPTHGRRAGGLGQRG